MSLWWFKSQCSHNNLYFLNKLVEYITLNAVNKLLLFSLHTRTNTTLFYHCMSHVYSTKFPCISHDSCLSTDMYIYTCVSMQYFTANVWYDILYFHWVPNSMQLFKISRQQIFSEKIKYLTGKCIFNAFIHMICRDKYKYCSEK